MSSASGLAATGLDDDLRAFAEDLPKSLKHLGPDQSLRRSAALARDLDLHLIRLFPRCIVGPEAGDHAGRYKSVAGHIDQAALGAIALSALEGPPITASEVTERNS